MQTHTHTEADSQQHCFYRHKGNNAEQQSAVSGLPSKYDR